MANIKSTKKRIVQSKKRRQYNTSRRSMLRTFVKKTYVAITSGDKEIAKNAFFAMQSIIDRQVSKGLIHKNKAKRHKTNLTAHIKAMQ